LCRPDFRNWRNCCIAHECWRLEPPRTGSRYVVMDRDMIAQHLAQAKRHADEDEIIVARQKELIAEIERQALDAANARASLALFRNFQKMHFADASRRWQEAQKVRSQEYRAKAEACEREAAEVRDPKVKRQLNGIAQQWRRFANLADRGEL
jgi:hypothetical protein